MQWFVFEDVENGCRRQVPKDVVDFAVLIIDEVEDFPNRVRLLRELFPNNLSLGDAIAVIRRAQRLAVSR